MSYLPHALSRRAVLTGVSVGATLLLAPTAIAQRKPPAAAEVPVDELMKSGDLADISLGSKDAKVTIVEYASLTCGHCANFHNKVLPELKTKYVDTGKVRFILREFPLDNLAAAAAMLARCSGGTDMARTTDMLGVLFAKQEDWAFVRGNPVPKLFEIAKQAGFTQDSFDKCLTDQKLLDQVTAVRERGSEKFGVSSTPSFFINGRRFTDAPTLAAFEKVIEPLLKAA